MNTSRKPISFYLAAIILGIAVLRNLIGVVIHLFGLEIPTDPLAQAAMVGISPLLIMPILMVLVYAAIAFFILNGLKAWDIRAFIAWVVMGAYVVFSLAGSIVMALYPDDYGTINLFVLLTAVIAIPCLAYYDIRYRKPRQQYPQS